MVAGDKIHQAEVQALDAGQGGDLLDALADRYEQAGRWSEAASVLERLDFSPEGLVASDAKTSLAGYHFDLLDVEARPVDVFELEVLPVVRGFTQIVAQIVGVAILARATA